MGREHVEKWCHQYRDRLFNFARRITNDAELAEELVQDVFLKVMELNAEKLPAIDAPPAVAASFLYRTLQYQWLNAWRKKTRRKEVSYGAHEPISNEAEPLENELATERVQLIRQALERLDETDRKIIHFVYFDRLGYAKVAKQIDCSLSTVKRRVEKARTKLARFFEELERTKPGRKKNVQEWIGPKVSSKELIGFHPQDDAPIYKFPAVSVGKQGFIRYGTYKVCCSKKDLQQMTLERALALLEERQRRTRVRTPSPKNSSSPT